MKSTHNRRYAEVETPMVRGCPCESQIWRSESTVKHAVILGGYLDCGGNWSASSIPQGPCQVLE